MKILQVNEYCGSRGGTELYVRLITESLIERGHEVGLLCDEVGADGCGRQSEAHQIRGIAPYLLQRGDELMAKVRDLAERENPDIINIHNIHNSRVIQCLLEMRPTVRYVHDHTLFCPRRKYYDSGVFCSHPAGRRCVLYTYLPFFCTGAFSRKPWMTKRYYSSFRATMEANRKLKGLAVASTYMKKSLVDNGFREDKIELLPYFTDVPGDNPPPGDNILFVGRLIPEKGVHLLVDALAEAGDGVRLVVVGDGPSRYREYLEKRGARLGLGSRIEFCGDQSHENLARFYVRSRAVAVPSIWPEPFGIVGIEAMAHGRPVVAFDVGGIHDWLVDGETGFLVPRGDVKGLSRRIGELIRSRDLSTQMGERGRAFVKRKFNRADHIERLLRFYRKACG